MKINLYGPICFTGYGVATTNILKALAEQGHEVSLWPIGNISAHEENGPLLEQCLKSGQLAYDKKYGINMTFILWLVKANILVFQFMN